MGEARGDEYEQKRFLRGPAGRRREQLLKQFCKTSEGQAGNSDAYRDNWDRIFNREVQADGK